MFDVLLLLLADGDSIGGKKELLLLPFVLLLLVLGGRLEILLFCEGDWMFEDIELMSSVEGACGAFLLDLFFVTVGVVVPSLGFFGRPRFFLLGSSSIPSKFSFLSFFLRLGVGISSPFSPLTFFGRPRFFLLASTTAAAATIASPLSFNAVNARFSSFNSISVLMFVYLGSLKT